MLRNHDLKQIGDIAHELRVATKYQPGEAVEDAQQWEQADLAEALALLIGA